MKRAVCLSAIVLLAVVGISPAAIILVPNEQPTIQAAINAANPGDAVVVSPGVYTGAGNWDLSFGGKAITVQSSNPNDPNVVAQTIIDCNELASGGGKGGGLLRVLHCCFIFQSGEKANSILDGFTIINAYGGGGGIVCQNSAPTIRNCVIMYCAALGNGGGISCYFGQSPDGYSYNYPQIVNCAITNNTSYGNGGGIYCYSSNLTITNCTINNNTASFLASGNYNGGGICCDSGSAPVITNCIIRGNYSKTNGGGVFAGTGTSSASATIINSIVIGNSAETNGGGICAGTSTSSASATIINSVIIGNSTTSGNGGGICGGTLTVTNCTIVANSAGHPGQSHSYPLIGLGGGIYGAGTLMNSIVWGNWDYYSTAHAYTNQVDIYVPQGVSPDITFNCIQNWYNPVIPGLPSNDPNSGNIEDNPLFVREPNLAIGEYGDLHLQKDSPCINTGSPNFIAGSIVDMDGQSRIMGGRIDMGADEYAQVIAVTAPKLGEVWTAGSSHEISWVSAGVNCFDIMFSKDSGGNWQTIANNICSTSKYICHLPDIVDSNQCLISVVPHIPDSNVVCLKSATFTVHPDSPDPAVTAWWTTLGGNFKRTGLSDSNGPELGCVKWSFHAGGNVPSSPTIGPDGVIHFGCVDGKVYTLNSDGQLLWSYDTGSPVLSSPTIGRDGTVYVGNQAGKLFAIDASGHLRWTFASDGFVYSSAAVSSNGCKIYACSQDGRLYAIARDGSSLWTFKTGGAILACPAVGADGTIYAGSIYDANLYALNPSDGSLKWSCKFPSDTAPFIHQPDKDPVVWPLAQTSGWPFASPVVGKDGTIYQTLLYDPNLYAIEPNAGHIIWSVNLRPHCDFIDNPCGNSFCTGFPPLDLIEQLCGDWFGIAPKEYVKHYQTDSGWSEPALGPDGTIYVNLDDPYLRAVNPDGSIKWVTRLGAVGGFTLAVGQNGLIYAAGGDEYLYVVNAAGKELSEFQRGFSWPVITQDGSLVISDSNDLLYAITSNCDSQTMFELRRPGDLRPDKTANMFDFALLAADWLGCTDTYVDAGQINPRCGYTGEKLYLYGDINKDLYVDFADLALMADRWLIQE